MEIKYINANAWFGAQGELNERFLHYFEHERADIIALQEVYKPGEGHPEPNLRMLDTLLETLDFTQIAFAPTFQHRAEDGRMLTQGNAIVSRYAIADHSYEFLNGDFSLDESFVPESLASKDYSYVARNIQHAIIDINGKELHVFNTQGIWGYDGDDNQARIKQSEQIVELIKGKDTAVLSGDFNVKEDTESISMIEGHMSNIFKGERGTSFNMKHKPEDSGFQDAVVDFIFAGKGIEVCSHKQPDIDISDHLPQQMNFRIVA